MKKRQYGLRVYSDESGATKCECSNTIIGLIELHEKSWTSHQKAIVSYFRLNPDFKHVQIAEHFKTTRPNITKTLTNIGYNAILEAEKTLRYMIQNIPEKM